MSVNTGCFMKNVYESIMIGGGIGGLTAGIYLSRFRIKTCIIDNKKSRASLIPCSHNFPGFPEGIRGDEILERLRKQYKNFNQELIDDTVISILKKESLFEIVTANSQYYSKTIIIATGVVDIEPNISNLKDSVKNGIIRHCLICDGYEAKDKKIIVIGSSKKSLKSAYLLKSYSDDVTLINIGKPIRLNPVEKKKLLNNPLQIINENIHKVEINNITKVTTQNNIFECDLIYSVLGIEPRSNIAIACGVKHSTEKLLIVNSHQETNIESVYAVGDITPGINQMTTAAADAIAAATHIFNKLRSL